MLEKYIKLKEKYPKSVIIIKSGNFYDCINDDAIIINRLLNYKIKELNKYIRVGFPVANINKVRWASGSLHLNSRNLKYFWINKKSRNFVRPLDETPPYYIYWKIF